MKCYQNMIDVNIVWD